MHLLRKGKPHLGLFAQLATNLVFDLGLHRPPPESPSALTICFKGGSLTAKLEATRSDEERRAALGTFLVTSLSVLETRPLPYGGCRWNFFRKLTSVYSVAHSLKRTDGLRWSPHLDQYLNHMAQHSTFLQDKVLVQQVRMQLIVEQINVAAWQANNGTPPAGYLAALRSRLQDIATRENMATMFRDHRRSSCYSLQITPFSATWHIAMERYLS